MDSNLQLRDRLYVLRQRLSDLTAFAGKAESARKRHAEVCTKHAAASQSFRDGRTQEAASKSVLMIIGLVAVYTIDVLLFGPVAEFFARRAFPNHPLLAEAARFVLPAAILCLEIMIGIQVHSASERLRYDGEGRKALWAWVALAVLLTLSMPAAVITVFFASAFRFAVWVSAFLLVTLLALSFAAHISIVFGGRLALESKQYLGCALRSGYFRCRMRATDAQEGRTLRRTIDAFRHYREHFMLLPGAEFGPFDSVTRNIVNDAFGYNIISVPPAPTNQVRAYLARSE